MESPGYIPLVQTFPFTVISCSFLQVQNNQLHILFSSIFWHSDYWCRKKGLFGGFVFISFSFKWKLNFWSSHTVQELRPWVLISLSLISLISLGHAWKQTQNQSQRLERTFRNVLICVNKPAQYSVVSNEANVTCNNTGVDARLGFSTDQGKIHFSQLSTTCFQHELVFSNPKYQCCQKSHLWKCQLKTTVKWFLIQRRPEALV